MRALVEFWGRLWRRDTRWPRAVAIAPAYDPLTSAWLAWMKVGLREWRWNGDTLLGKDASRSRWLEWAAVAPSGATLMVFFGHGSDVALLTAPLASQSSPASHSELCLVRDFSARAQYAVVAYCCQAGRTFAGRLVARCPGSRVIAFDERIPVVLGIPAAEDSFRRPISRAVAAALESGDVSRDTLDVLTSDLERELQSWESPPMAAEPWAPMITASLRAQRNLARFYS